MRILVFSKYSRKAASARLRFLQYESALKNHGIELVLSPLFDDAYLEHKFAQGHARRRDVLRAVGRRLGALTRLRNFDLAVITYELFPYSPALIEPVLNRLGLPYVFDYDDATFHMYDNHANPWIRRLLGNKIGRVIRPARAVIAGSRYLAAYAQKYHSRVHIIPTVVDTQRYRVRETPPASKPFTVGWIGSPSTATYLPILQNPLRRLGQEGPVRFIAVGATPYSVPGVEVDVRPWSEAREIDDLLEFDVGVMPMQDNPWARGKCAFKLIQYMGCGLPTIASPVGANLDVVTEDTGRFADTEDAWLDTFRMLRDHSETRHALGLAGRRRVETHYSLHSQIPRLAHVLKQASHR